MISTYGNCCKHDFMQPLLPCFQKFVAITISWQNRNTLSGHYSLYKKKTSLTKFCTQTLLVYNLACHNVQSGLENLTNISSYDIWSNSTTELFKRSFDCTFWRNLAFSVSQWSNGGLPDKNSATQLIPDIGRHIGGQFWCLKCEWSKSFSVPKLALRIEFLQRRLESRVWSMFWGSMPNQIQCAQPLPEN